LEKVASEKIKNLVEFWKEGSDEAFLTAIEIFQNTSKYAMVLFNLHLAVEKSLKSKIVEKLEEYAPFTHNLVHLASKIESKLAPEKVQALARLSEFNLSTRYPEDKETVRAMASRELAESEIASTKELLSWIASL
jgi:HEPN domain-containing protein